MIPVYFLSIFIMVSIYFHAFSFYFPYIFRSLSDSFLTDHFLADNILLDEAGRVKLADFGASSTLSADETLANEFKGVKGTVAYMCPEMIRGGSYGRKCDIWSLGTIVIEMVTGKRPWSHLVDSNYFAVLYHIGSTEAPHPLPDDTPPLAVDFIHKSMDRVPQQRPSAEDLLLHNFLLPES